RPFDFDDDPLNILKVQNNINNNSNNDNSIDNGNIKDNQSQSHERKRRLQQVYRTKYQEPFYKGGLVKDRIPSFCDRVLYHSLNSYKSHLVPENDMGILNSQSCVYKNSHNYGCIPH